MEENIKNLPPHKIVLRNKYFKSYEDFIKDLFNSFNSDQIKSTEYFDINRNYLNEVDFAKILTENLFDNKRLILINLTANDLTMIPKEIAFCSNLERLILNNNKIKKIDNLETLASLKSLELRSNRIEKWENLEKLTNLNFLTLSSNLIRKIDNISEHPNLEELGIFGNYLGNENSQEENLLIFEDLLKQVSNCLPKLKRLFIGGNHFYKLPNYLEIIKSHISSIESIDGEIL